MSHREPLRHAVVAISIADTPDMAAIGLAQEHLVDAMAEVARHLLALGARIAYGVDLRDGGFADLLSELVARHRHDAHSGDARPPVLSFVPWAMHAARSPDEIHEMVLEFDGMIEFHLLDAQGRDVSLAEIAVRQPVSPTPSETAASFAAMRDAITRACSARIVVGGSMGGLEGRMPDIAEEALCSLRARQSLYVLGGFGGCARAVAEELGLFPRRASGPSAWPGRSEFASYRVTSPINGLNAADNALLARTVHIDQAMVLVLRGELYPVRTAEAVQAVPSIAARAPLLETTVFVVHAPLGTDAALSTYPDGVARGIAEHPLVGNLRKVAACGVAVSALVDLHDDATYLVDIPADRPQDMIVLVNGKMNMVDPRTLTELIVHAHRFSGASRIVLAIEGHGVGFMPDLEATSSLLRIPPGSSPVREAVMSTWGVGEALRAGTAASVPRVAAIHLNNSFSMSIELLHTIAPYAEYATGYCDFNFFSAGQAYPAVFARLAAAGSASSEQLAKWFAAENHNVLSEAGHEPTVAGTVDLARMHEIAGRVDDLSDALLAALRTASVEERPLVVARIKRAIIAAQHRDSRGEPESPEELTDLDSLASELTYADFGRNGVIAAADALRSALASIRQSGGDIAPWMAPVAEAAWNFSSTNLAMNIFLPDPLQAGLPDWRAPYYLDVNPDPTQPQVQRHVIDFVRETDWVDFLFEYHRDTSFVATRPEPTPYMPLLGSRGHSWRRGSGAIRPRLP